MELNDKLKLQLGNWWPIMEPLIRSETWNNLFRFLKQESKFGRIIIPGNTELFKSFELCDKNKIRCLLLLQCPYATKRQDIVIADGIPMNCENIKPYQQPSLYQFLHAIEETYGFDPDNDVSRCDISYLLREEHVMLLNSSLTVQLGQVSSHSQQWIPVMSWICKEIFDNIIGMPVILIGEEAQKFEKFFNPLSHHILKLEHMAYAARMNRSWIYKDCFAWVNKILRDNNGKSEEINWLRKKVDKVPRDRSVPVSSFEGDSDMPF